VNLTVCIPTTPYRIATTLPRLVQELDRQMAGRDDCELLCVLDNESISIGRKMNEMARLAQGRYVSFIADDDMPRPDYVAALCEAIALPGSPDVICFDTAYLVGGKHIATIYESKELEWAEDWDAGRLDRFPSDKQCWRRNFFLAHPHINAWHADIDFATKVVGQIESERQIGRVRPAQPQGQRVQGRARQEAPCR
jgi:hypothetical protein